MIIKDNNIIIEETDKKNNYKKLKKYKDKNYFITNDAEDEISKAFIKAFNEKDIEKRYKYIYDYMCKYLDKNVCSLCDFKNNKCKGNRSGISAHKDNGCCYFRKEGFCMLFKDKKCTNPNISCKLFMCSLIEKEIGFKSIPKNYLLLNFFFNQKQQEILKHSYKIKKEDTIIKLIKSK